MQPIFSSFTLRVLSLTVLLPFAGCGGAGTASPDSTSTHEHDTIGVSRWSDTVELFFEYPALVAGIQSEPWAVHLTNLEDYKPVSEAVLTLAFRNAAGQVYTTRVETLIQPGIYAPAPVLPAAGRYDLIVDLEGSGQSERFDVGHVDVYPDVASVPHLEQAGNATDIPYLKEQQWTISFEAIPAREQPVLNTITVSGDIIPAAGRMAVVAAPVSGLAQARKNLGAPAPGDRVRAGQTLILLSPTAQDNSFAQARAEASRLEREVGRLQRLFDAEAVPEKRLVEARQELDVARASLEAMGGAGANGYDFPVKAPISGSVQSRRFIPGQRVEAGETLFEIVDSREVWLHLHVPARHASLADAVGRATFTVEGSSRLYTSNRIVSSGSIIDPETRTLPVILTVDNADGSLKIGQFTSAHLDVGAPQTGIAIPNEAILNEDGQPVAYIQVSGESFERRVLRLGTTDGLLTLIESGVEEGDRVVTQGGYQIYLASLSTNEIADHGHPH